VKLIATVIVLLFLVAAVVLPEAGTVGTADSVVRKAVPVMGDKTLSPADEGDSGERWGPGLPRNRGSNPLAVPLPLPPFLCL
jgi:hypothetical protein